MAEKNQDTKQNIAILKALNEAIEKGPWEVTVFFQAMRNKLVEIRDRFKQDVNLEDIDETTNSGTLFDRIAKRSGITEVYILLYNADGGNLAKWENILRTISNHTVSRPIYNHEKNARSALRAAATKQNEAYISVFVPEEDILPTQADRKSHDRYGHEILNLKEGAIKADNIHQFIHVSGRYDYDNNKLVWHSVVDFL
jgi:intracellular multiplication protein IcmQ